MQNKSLLRAAADVLLLHLEGGESAVAFLFCLRDSRQPPRAADLQPANEAERTDCNQDLHAEPRFLQEQFSRNCEPDAAQTPIVA